LANLRPDIVHVNQVSLPAMAAAALIPRSALVITAHNPALRHEYNAKGRLLAAAVKNRPVAWIVLSDRNRRLLADDGVRRRSIHVIPPGLPPQRFLAPLDARTARVALSVPNDSFLVGTVGRLARQKRHDVLLRACAMLKARIPRLHLVIVGEGELLQETQRLADELLPGSHTFAGQRPNVPQLLPALDVFAMSSDFEGLPFALLEAMATGLPIVTTDVQGTGEAITDEVEGLLVPAQDPDALAQAIERLATDAALAQRLGLAAKTRFGEEFTTDLMVQRTEELYERILGRTDRDRGISQRWADRRARDRP
jgi:glycosyltransferase involved in cell wall biosynthesis